MKYIILLICVAMCSCTLSFQNISTHGTASDLVDEALTNDPTVTPTVNVPVSLVPKLPSIPGVAKVAVAPVIPVVTSK